MAVHVYGCVLRFIDDVGSCTQRDVDDIKLHLIESVPNLRGFQVSELGICMRPPYHPCELCDGTTDDTLLLVVHYHDGSCGQGIGIDPDGFIFYTEPFDPRFLGPLPTQIPSTFFDLNCVQTEIKCDGCGRGFGPLEYLHTDYENLDLCEHCHPHNSDELQRTTASNRAHIERTKRIELIRRATGLEVETIEM